METLVYFMIGDTEFCGRVGPLVGAEPGGRMKLTADLNHMHLIDDATGAVI